MSIRLSLSRRLEPPCPGGGFLESSKPRPATKALDGGDANHLFPLATAKRQSATSQPSGSIGSIRVVPPWRQTLTRMPHPPAAPGGVASDRRHRYGRTIAVAQERTRV